MAKVAPKQRTVLQAAKAYVDEQLATMKKGGAVGKLSSEEYKALIHKIVEATVK
jgi:hypothetical protein